MAESKIARRAFLAGGGLLAAGLVVGFYVRERRLGTPPPPEETHAEFDGYLRIAPDGTVTVLSAHMDMGQGIYTGIATLVAEEMDADWNQMRAMGAAGDPKRYGNIAWGGEIQGTGGSTGIASSFGRYRVAGAAARAMLETAAAEAWGVPAKEIEIEGGVISHRSGKSGGFGDFAEAASKLPVPQLVVLKEPHEWRYIGNESLRRLDGADKTTGRQSYTLDVRLPDMLTAVVARPPKFGATLKSFDAKAAKRVPGVVAVEAIPRGVAVVAKDTWSAIKGRAALVVEWDESGAEARGSEALFAEYRRLAVHGAPQAQVVRHAGDLAEGMAEAERRIEAQYEVPYLAHAALEPLGAVAWKRGDRLEVWGGHPLPDLYQAAATRIAEVPAENVKMHVMMTGGGFGRRAVADSDVVVEAVSTAKAIGWRAPVKVMWTREDDMTGGRYRPMYVHALKAGLGKRGRPTAWHHRVVGQSIMKGTPFEGGLQTNGVDVTTVEGAVSLPYEVSNLRIEAISTEVGVPVLWWRAVGSTHNAFATECFIDEMARVSNKDPLFYRLDILNGWPRHQAALIHVRDVSRWGKKLPKGWGRGVAVAASFGSVVAQVAEVSVIGGKLKVERVVCAVDCGLVVNPDNVKAQMEGGIGFALGAALKGAITFEDGRVMQSNFDGYPVLTMDEMPRVEVHIMKSRNKPTGVGEPGVPPTAPAVCNAIFDATGKRIRRLPINLTDLSL